LFKEGVGDATFEEEGGVSLEGTRLLGAGRGGDAVVGGIDSSMDVAQEER
jgi:hypothetical protein